MSEVQRFEHRQRLRATPEALWPLVADTPTLNRAAGLPPVEYEITPVESGGSRIAASVRVAGRRVVRWTEQPFFWREAHGYVVVREFQGGPFAWMRAGVELARVGDGTNVLVFTEIEPRNPLGTLLLRLGFGQRAVDRMAGQVALFDRFLAGEIPDPFPSLRPRSRPPERAGRIVARLIADGCPTSIVERLYAHLTTARDEEVARMRPFELADRWGEDRRATLAVFLQATVGGLLTLSWDVLCPGCRVGKREVSALRELRAQAHCDVCNITFDASFDQLVEVRFGPAPAIRTVPVREFCIGGPVNTPHIVAQAPLGPGEQRTLDVRLRPGRYVVRAAGAGGAAALEVGAARHVGERAGDRGAVATVATAATLTVARDGLAPGHVRLAAGDVTLGLANALDRPIAVVVEDGRWPDTICTAALVSTLPEFRDLFSSEVLAPGLQLGVSRLAFLFTDLTGSTALYRRVGQARAFRIVQDQFAILGEAIAAHNGAVVKTIGDAVMAAFTTGADALAAGLAIQREIVRLELRGEADPRRLVRVGIHQGPCVAVTANERLDYFGTTVNIASRVEHEARGGEVAATADVCESPDAQPVLAAANVRAEQTVAYLKGIEEPVRLYRLALPDDG